MRTIKIDVNVVPGPGEWKEIRLENGKLTSLSKTLPGLPTGSYLPTNFATGPEFSADGWIGVVNPKANITDKDAHQKVPKSIPLQVPTAVAESLLLGSLRR
ncbi:hypothetical protein FRC09_000026 [Ceratobasidium sp. 395]|nr:hypothetical protein FRC09_000026 [Ceratobasidium sp. 395]